MNAINNLLFAPINDTTHLDEVLNETAHMDTAELLALVSRPGACTGLELVLLELTRFRGHIILCVQGVANVKSTTAVPGGIPPADGRAGSSRALTLAALS